MAAGGEDQHAFRLLAEREGLLAVGGDDLRDDEFPGADELLAQRLARLRGAALAPMPTASAVAIMRMAFMTVLPEMFAS